MCYIMIYINLLLLHGSPRAYGNMVRENMFLVARESKILDSGQSSDFLYLQVALTFISLNHLSTSV